MTKYTCEACDFKTNLRANYTRHNSTKKHCETVKNEGVIPSNPNIIPSNPNIIPSNPNNNPNIIPSNPNIIPSNPNIIPNNPNNLHAIIPSNPNNSDQIIFENNISVNNNSENNISDQIISLNNNSENNNSIRPVNSISYNNNTDNTIIENINYRINRDESNKITYSCHYCNNVYKSKNGIYKHINELRCKILPDHIKKNIINNKNNKKIDKIKQKSNGIFKEMLSKIDKNILIELIEKHLNCNLKPNDNTSTLVNNTNNSTNNNTDNSIENNNCVENNTDNSNTNNIGSINNQTITNNQFININPLGKEDISFLTNEMKIGILDKMYLALPELVKTIHNKECNRNVYYKNIKDNIMAFVDDNQCIRLDNNKNVIERIIDGNIDRLDDIYQEVGDNVNVNKDRLKKMIQLNNDRELNQKYLADLNYYFQENSNKNKKLLKNKNIDVI